ncbi:Crp/Fnr family transcriptional regulator, partial [Carboxylicivirga litoralis]|uniref:Crp/Fnr family transcriptional regulator n=1 Tax=Carboxylicivirga litoralis TaxID=2816963 RepID=UPI0021CB2329
MIGKLINKIKESEENRKGFQSFLIEKEISPKTVLLNEGEISNKIFFIKKGCLREWFNKDGKDITFQFFFEEQPVASIDSFMNQKPSLFTIESIEPTTILTVEKIEFEKL